MTGWLVDKSALVRLGESPDTVQWAQRIQRGLVRITTVTRLEVGYSARSGQDARSMFARPPLSAMPVEYLTPAIEDRSVEVQLLLAGQGQHRAPPIPGDHRRRGRAAGPTVLHLDKDSELIAGITGQPTERLQV